MRTPQLGLVTRLSAASVFILLVGFGCSKDDDGPNDIDIGDELGEDDDYGDEFGTNDGLEEEGGSTSDGGDGDGDEGTTGDSGDTGDGDGDSDTEEPPYEESDTTDTTDTTETGEPMCNDQDAVVLYLSPDDSNSMSSPVQVKDRVIAENQTNLGTVPIRVWEFMNYYGFPYPAADDATLGLHAAMQLVEGEDATWRMQIGVASEQMLADERPPLNVTLVLDTSGSMQGEAIELLKATANTIAGQLRAGDKVSIVEWSVGYQYDLGGYEVDGPNDPVVLAEIASMQPGGGTDLNGGLVAGYELAAMVYDPGALNRLVLVTDGGANAGITDIELIAQNAVLGGSDGVYLVGVGVESSSMAYNDELIDDVTDAGKGASVFIHTAQEAERLFGEQFLSTMGIAARNVQVELTLPPGFEIVKFSGEEFSGDPEEVEPQHLAPNDAMVFHQQIQTCAPELVTGDTEITVKATWEDVWSFEPLSVEQTWTFEQLWAQDQNLLLKGAAVLAYAEGLAAFKKAGTDNQKTAALAPAFERLELAQAALPDDADLEEIATILQALDPSL